MKLIDNMRLRMTALRLGMQIIGAGFFKAPGQGLLSAIAQLLQPRWGEPPKRNSKQWIELYGKSPRLRPIYRIAKDVAAADWGLYVKRGKEKEQILEHPMINLLNRPNPKMTGSILMFLTEVYLQLRGECGWLIEYNGLRAPAELWPVPPHWVADIPSASKPYFTVTPYNLVGITMYIEPQDMIWFVEPDPVNPYSRGLGPADGIGDEVETDEYMAKWAKRFFFNDAKPPVVIQAPGADKPTADRLKEEWMERYAGYANAHKPAILPWDAKIQELGKPAREMDFVESRRFLRDTSNQHWMIPPEIMGIIENSNRATIDAADYLYCKGVLKPALDLIKDVIQMSLCPQFDEKLLFEFENVIPEDKEYKLKVANDGLKGGALEVDEWRQANGYDPLPNGRGKVLYVPISVIPTSDPAGEPPSEPPPEGGEAGGKRAKGELSPEQKTAIWWMFEKGAVKQEALFKRVVKKFFQEQQDAVNARIEQLFGDKSARKDIDNIIEMLLAWAAENDKLKAVLKPAWLAGWKEGWEIVENTFNLGVSFDLLNPRFLLRADEYGADQVKGINATTKDALRDELVEGIANGESVPKLRGRVSRVFADAKGRRAETIARTESHNSVGAGTFETYRVAEVGKKEWLATKDSRTRDSHRNIDGQVRPMDQPFSNGLMYPGAPGPAKEVVNCRCALLPVIE